MEQMSFDSAEMEEMAEFIVKKSLVQERLKDIAASSDLSR